jgi:tetratricopeptide (TPR) repeat protein
MHKAACEATHVHGEQSETLLDERIRCLDRRLDELGALTDLFAHADAQVVENASTAVARLPGLDACEAGSVVRSGAVALPSDPEQRRSIHELESELARSRAEGDAGRIDVALTRAEDVVVRAEALDFAPLVAEGSYQVGHLRGLRGDSEGAEKALLHSHDMADAAGLDRLRGEALANLVWIVGHLGADYEAAHLLADRAQAVVERLGDNELESQCLSNLGVILTEQGRFPEAVASIERALELRTVIGDESSVLRASLLNNLASTHFLKGDHRSALTAYEASRTLYEARLGPAHPKVAATLGNIGNAYNALGEHERAIDYIRRSREVVIATHGERALDVALTSNNLAVVYHQTGRFDEAAAEYLRAIEIWRAADPGHPQLATGLANLAEIRMMQGRRDDALGLAEEALVIIEAALSKDHVLRAVVLTTLGWVALDGDELVTARQRLDEARRVFAGTQGDPLLAAQADFHYGCLLAREGQLPEGTDLVERADAVFGERDAAWAERSRGWLAENRR